MEVISWKVRGPPSRDHRVSHRAIHTYFLLHAREPITLGMRAVLEHPARKGPATVPAIARARYVTRQHIQVLVNGLLDRKLVELQNNPAHRRSPPVRFTPEGERTIKRMKSKEGRLLARDFRLGDADLQRAAEILRAVRAGLGRRPR